MKEQYKLVVIGPTGTWHSPRDVEGDPNRPDEFRDHLIAIAKRDDSYNTTGSPGDWIGDFEGRLYTEREYRKGAYPGGWAEPEKTLRYTHAWG